MMAAEQIGFDEVEVPVSRPVQVSAPTVDSKPAWREDWDRFVRLAREREARQETYRSWHR